MSDSTPSCLVILAGGRSQRMGSDKAEMEFQGQRIVDRLISRFRSSVDQIIISAASDYDTGLQHIPDHPDMPGGPVGAIFSIARHLEEHHPRIKRFYTIPVDAPFAPLDLVTRLASREKCTVANAGERLQPTFALWQCAIINTVRHTHDKAEKAPSLHWLAHQCGGQVVTWSDDKAFTNINTPEEFRQATRST